MSLRLRLTLIYTGLLSGAVLLLSIVINSMVNVVMIDQVDSHLDRAGDQIMEALRADTLGGLAVNTSVLNLSDDIYYQVWTVEGKIAAYSNNAAEFTRALDQQALTERELAFSEAEIDELDYRVLTIPLVVEGQNYGLLQLGTMITELRYTQRLLLIVLGIATIFTILIAGIVGWLVTGQALEPLEMMAKITNQITSTDDLSQRIPMNAERHDEIGDLILTFNQTLVRLERLFNAQSRFLADVSHELRTPLTVIKGNVGLMRIMNTLDQESLDSIEAEVDRLTRLVGDLLLMAQAETGKLPLMMELVEIDNLLFEVFEQLKVLSEGKHVIQIGNLEPVRVSGDSDRLKQVFLNIGSNAIKYTPEGGTIELSLAVRKNWVEVKISDEGVGIPKTELSRLFERFYRGDKSRSRSKKDVGFGLGLPIAYWIVRNHGGRIEVDTDVESGTTFTVWLPVSQAEIPTRPMGMENEKKYKTS